MTQEEKYRKALLEARAVLEPCLKYSNGKVREALDSIDKELKSFESEDERILRVISEAVITFFSDYANDFEDEDRDAALAWLEKQKEQKPEAKAKSPLSPHELYDAKIEGISQGRQDVLDHPEQFGLQKPVEWSREDQKSLNRAINICISDFGEDCETARFLKSLPKRFNLQPKQEWSDEDERVLKGIIGLVDHDQHYGVSNKEMISWLKSLRPQYHGDVTMTEAYKMGLEAGKASSWKPSEEQMKVFDGLCHNYILDKKDYKVLESLYEQLKKL